MCAIMAQGLRWDNFFSQPPALMAEPDPTTNMVAFLRTADSKKYEEIPYGRTVTIGRSHKADLRIMGGRISSTASSSPCADLAQAEPSPRSWRRSSGSRHRRRITPTKNNVEGKNIPRGSALPHGLFRGPHCQKTSRTCGRTRGLKMSPTSRRSTRRTP